MNRKIITLLTSILIISLFSFNVFAEDVLDQAIRHAEGATRASDGKAAARHAADSKAQAEVAKKDEDEKNNKTAAKHIEDGIKSLDEVLKVGNEGKTEAAKKAASDAVNHFKQATKTK